MPVFDQFEAIYIINLPYRKDRRADMERELRRVGLLPDERVRFFPAFRFEDPGPFSSIGARGVFESHLTILETAARDGVRVLILEDDVDFTHAVDSYKMPSDWSVFYGGYQAADPHDLLRSDIIGAHMMGFSPDAADSIARYLRTFRYDGIHPPIDGAYIWFRRAFPEVRTVFAEPVLGVQRPSRTDIADLRFFDRLPYLRSLAAVGRRLKRKLLFRR